jgi:hypothetical protein
LRTNITGGLDIFASCTRRPTVKGLVGNDLVDLAGEPIELGAEGVGVAVCSHDGGHNVGHVCVVIGLRSIQLGVDGGSQSIAGRLVGYHGCHNGSAFIVDYFHRKCEQSFTTHITSSESTASAALAF